MSREYTTVIGPDAALELCNKGWHIQFAMSGNGQVGDRYWLYRNLSKFRHGTPRKIRRLWLSGDGNELNQSFSDLELLNDEATGTPWAVRKFPDGTEEFRINILKATKVDWCPE